MQLVYLTLFVLIVIVDHTVSISFNLPINSKKCLKEEIHKVNKSLMRFSIERTSKMACLFNLILGYHGNRRL
jgi:hypothetical protein